MKWSLKLNWNEQLITNQNRLNKKEKTKKDYNLWARNSGVNILLISDRLAGFKISFSNALVRLLLDHWTVQITCNVKREFKRKPWYKKISLSGTYKKLIPLTTTKDNKTMQQAQKKLIPLEIDGTDLSLSLTLFFWTKIGGATLFSFGLSALCAASKRIWRTMRTRLSVGNKQKLHFPYVFSCTSLHNSSIT